VGCQISGLSPLPLLPPPPHPNNNKPTQSIVTKQQATHDTKRVFLDPTVLTMALASVLVAVGSCVLNDWFDFHVDQVGVWHSLTCTIRPSMNMRPDPTSKDLLLPPHQGQQAQLHNRAGQSAARPCPPPQPRVPWRRLRHLLCHPRRLPQVHCARRRGGRGGLHPHLQARALPQKLRGGLCHWR
jgi:hypothetical protein